MKKFKSLLYFVLSFAMLVGLVVPLVTSAQASDYTLTVLNPMGPLVPRNNLPLADRQPLLNKLEARGALGPVKILLLNYDKNADQLQMWALAIALQEKWEAMYPGSDIQIVRLDASGTPASYGVNPAGWDWNTQGTIPRLGSPWGPKTGYSHIDGMPLFEEPLARYRYWALNHDFILFGEQN